jgi:hypothetical protein
LDVPISPIDHIKQRIEESGYSIGEITGRQTVVVNGVLRPRNKAEQKTAGKKNTIAKFNNGGLDALIINRSGSTGLSMHASEKFGDQRRRVMIIGQAELDINNHMQMLGRINRTGQVTQGPFDDDTGARRVSFASRARMAMQKAARIGALREAANNKIYGGKSPYRASLTSKRIDGDLALAELPKVPEEDTGRQRYYKGKPASYGLPHYYQMTADVPIELRPAAVLAKKMAALNANTTADKKSAVEAGSLDFMNKYGDLVAVDVLMADPGLNAKLGFPVRPNMDGDIDPKGVIAKVTGRVGLLPLKDQSDLYQKLATEYKLLIDQLDAMGMNDLEAKTYPLDAKVIKTEELLNGTDDSPFTSAVTAESVNVRKLGKPYSSEKVRELIEKTLGGAVKKSASDAHYNATLDKYNKRIQSEIAAFEQVVAANESAAAVANAKTRIEKLKTNQTRFREVLQSVGLTKVLKMDSGNFYGVVTDVFHSGDDVPTTLSAWKVRFAVVDGAKSITLPFTKIYTTNDSKVPEGGVLVDKATEMILPTADRMSFEAVSIFDAFDRGQTDSRENRVIVTGNLLRAAANGVQGRIMNYTDENGVVKQGILLPATDTIQAISGKFMPSINTYEQLEKVISNDGMAIDKKENGDIVKIVKSWGDNVKIFLGKALGKRIVKFYSSIYFTSAGGRFTAHAERGEELKKFFDFLSDQDNGLNQRIELVPDGKTSKKVKSGEIRFSRKPAQTETEAFKKWFGDSKVVDENGKPLVVYHGTILHKGQGGIGDITAFDRLFTTKIRGASIDTVGSWFSTNPGDGGAEMYSGNSSGSAIYPVHLSIQNPHVTTFQQMERHARKLANGKDDGRKIGKPEVDAYRNWLKSMGKDGIKIEASGNEGSTEFDNQVAWIALEPTQVKSAIGNNGEYDSTNPDIRYSRGNFFYSALSKGIEGMATKQAMAGAWAMQLQGLVKKGAVKQAEIEWSGVTDWLKLQEGKVTKEQITAYLDANGVQVQEVVLDDAGDWVVYDGEDNQYFGSRAEAVKYAEGNGIDANEDTIFKARELAENTRATKYSDSNLQLPGGTNYREVLLTLPIKQTEGVPEGYKLIDIAEEDRADGFDIPAEETGPWRFTGPSVSSKVYKTRQEAMEALQKEIKSDQSAGILTGKYQYTSNHWDQPNVLAHIRVNDRTDAEDNKVLMVEELQSDWGQDGKKRGFGKVTRFEYEVVQDNGQLVRAFRDKEEAEAFAAERNLQINEIPFNVDTGIPLAPFVTTTDGWLNLGLKAIIKMAVDGGYDKVAFVNGEQSADRYDLSKQVDEVFWMPASGVFWANKGINQVAREENVDEAKLATLVGKDVAKKLIAAPLQKQMLGNGRFHKLAGADLKVGGEGMKAFYDKIVPNTVNALLKKVGGGRVEGMLVGGRGSTGPYFVDSGPMVDGIEYDSLQVAQSMAAANRGTVIDRNYNAVEMLTQPGFTITDAMRKQASGGLPLFSKAGKASGMPLVQVREIVDVIRSQWGNAPDMVVAANMNDPIIPQAVRDADKRQQSQGAVGNVEGFVYGGKVYVVASELNTPTDVLRVLFHESLGHMGLRGVFGKSMEQVLNQVILGRRKEVIAKAISYGLDPSNKDDLLEAAEEVLAEMAQSRPELGFVQRAIAAIRNFLRANVPFFSDLELTDADIIQGFILPARRFVENGGGGGGGKGKTAFSLKERLAPNGRPSKLNAKQYAEVRTPQFKAWFGDWESDPDNASKAVDPETGEPMVVYHGSLGDISTFSPSDFYGSGFFGKGINLTESANDASKYASKDVGVNLDIGSKASIFAEKMNMSYTEAKEMLLSGNETVYSLYASIKNPLRINGEKLDISEKVLRLALAEINYKDDADLFIRQFNRAKNGIEQFKVVVNNRASQIYRQIASIQNKDGLIIDGSISPKSGGAVHLLALDSTQVKSAIGNNGDFDPNNPDIRFSRTPLANANFSIGAQRTLQNSIVNRLNDLRRSSAKVNWWNKSVGTQYHLAESNSEYKRTFDAVQRFLSDTSIFANKAADLAPTMLPKLEKLKDFVRKALPASDVKAVSSAVFGGTLHWARDKSGNLVLQDTLLKAAAQLTTHEKAQELLRSKKIASNVLQMWQGMTIEKYESLVNNKYEKEMLPAGVVFTPDELRKHFGMTDGQISLYQEFREATNRSLTDLALSEMVRMGGADLYPISEMLMEHGDVKKAADEIRQYLESIKQAKPEREAELNDSIDKVQALADRALDLMNRGYAPLSRFGKYAVYAKGPNGEQLFFGMYESQREANWAETALRENLPNAQISSGIMSQEQHKLFQGVSPETLALFGDAMGLDTDSEKAALYQEFVKLVADSRSTMRRMLNRKGIAGYSEDATRVLAGFITSNSRKTSANLNNYELEKSVNEITAGDVKDEAIKLKNYVQNPEEEAQWVRGMLFTQYIGGSVASAMVNLTQSLTMTFPYLSQFTTVADAGARMANAVKMAGTGKGIDDEMKAALKRAEDDGVVAPQEIHQLMAHAQGRGGLKSGDGTSTGDAMAAGSNALSKMALLWGSMFSAAEVFNRTAAFIAAYQLAKDKNAAYQLAFANDPNTTEKNLGDPFAFAEKTIRETQGIYNKGNKPAWARGAIGSVLFTFKQFSISYVEFLLRMYSNNKHDKIKAAKALGLTLGVLWLMAGVSGLPGGDDLDDVIDSAAQAMGYSFSFDQKKQEFFENALGSPAAAQFFMYGFTGLPGMPIDVSGRMGLGNLFPGTGLLVRKDDHTRDIAEIFGPISDLLKRTYNAGGEFFRGNVLDAAIEISPVAARNFVKGIDMMQTGTFRDAKESIVIETDTVDAVNKMAGFQPQHVAQVQRATFSAQKLSATARMVKSEIVHEFAVGRFERDQSKIDAARKRLQRWNEKNPSIQIRITVQQVNQKVQNMNKTKAQRVIAAAPKEVKAQVQRELAGFQ